MADHGRPWQTMADHGRPWQTMADHGRPVSKRLPCALRGSVLKVFNSSADLLRSQLPQNTAVELLSYQDLACARTGLQLGIHRVNGQPKLLLQTGAVQGYFNRVSQSRSKSLRTPTYQETSRNKSKNVKDNMASRLSHQCGSCLQPGCLLQGQRMTEVRGG